MADIKVGDRVHCRERPSWRNGIVLVLFNDLAGKPHAVVERDPNAALLHRIEVFTLDEIKLVERF